MNNKPGGLFSLNLLEFNKLLGLIADFVHSESSRDFVLAMRPMADRSAIEKRLGQVGEMIRIYDEGGSLALHHFSDLGPLLERVAPEGAVLEGIELAEFIPVLDNIRDVQAQIREYEKLLLLN
ncbi:MAG: hypothetical protein HQL08_15835, partial [Nitrospirae bacterium]|nr:hypothetical protein [Nitrospirota bacterium]